MPTLYPPLYPDCPDAPLLSYGRAFAEEIARSLLAVVWHGDEEGGGLETDVQAAAALTMLEAFHPRDQLECMIAAQGVACHATIMDCFRRAMDPEAGFAETVKSRSNAAQLIRTFSALLAHMERRQAKPLPPRPSPDGAPDEPPPGVGGPDTAPPRKSRAKKPLPPTAAPADDACPAPTYGDNPAPESGDNPAPESGDGDPGDILSRPDGTPGSLAAYAPRRPPDDGHVPGEPAIMIALATRPKPWRQINVPAGQALDAPAAEPAATDGTAADGPRLDGPIPDGLARDGSPPDAAADLATPRRLGVLNTTERLFTGDALARFASARLDPGAPKPDFIFADEESVFELELLDTGPAAACPIDRPDPARPGEAQGDAPPTRKDA